MKINRGDKFTVEFTADSDSTPGPSGTVSGSVHGTKKAYFFLTSIKETTPKPWEPKIGEEVDLYGRIIVTQHGFTLLNVHGDGTPFHDGTTRKWAVVAFVGDRPEVVPYVHIRQRIKN